MRTSRQATLRRTWVTSLLQLMVIVVGLGAFAVGTTWYSSTVVHETTAEVEGQLTSLSTLKAAIADMSVAATPVIYGLDGSATAAENLSTYMASAARVSAEFDSARRTFPSDEAEQILQAMVATWHALDAVIEAAPDERAAGAFDVFAAGTDPFVDTVWGRYNEIGQGLTALSNITVVDLRGTISDFDRVQRWILPTALGAVVLALLMGWLAALRISRRVVSPLSTLRIGALAMREGNAAAPIVLMKAANELHDLAHTINETSAALRATHAALRGQATTDSLTDLPNRRGFTDLLDLLFAHADHRHVCVLFIDLDDFKVVNDSMGHAAGDELLRIVARRLRSVARDGETVARLGGDEFAIVLSSDDAAAAIAVAERTLAAMQAPVVINGTTVDVGCSIGVALSTDRSGPTAADELVRNADFAMYTAKSQGKNRFELFAPTMATSA